MKQSYALLIFVFIIVIISAIMGCSSKTLYENDLVGVYSGKRISKKYVEKINCTHEEIMAYLCGDTLNNYSYEVYHNLPPFYLILEDNHTFKFVGFEAIFGSGTWKIIGKDTLLLSFKQVQKGTNAYAAIALSPRRYEGVRKLKILNKNKLRFEYIPYNAPEGWVNKTIFKKSKRK